MAALVHTDIRDRVMNRLRIPTTNTAEATKVSALINDNYRSIATMHPAWWFLIDRQIINTVADLTTGTVASTSGSLTVTFSSAPAASVAGRKLSVTGNRIDTNVLYRIASHIAGAATATLDAAYTGTTVTASAYAVYADEYSLSADTNRVVSILRPGWTVPMHELGWREMDGLKAYNTGVGRPQFWSQRNFAASGDPTTAKVIVFHPYPDETYRMEIHYVQALNTEVSGATRYFLPDDYVDVLLHATLADGYVIFLDDATRGAYHRQRADALLARMIATQRGYDDAPTIQPNAAGYRGFYSRRGLSPSNVDLGSYFDRYPGVR